MRPINQLQSSDYLFFYDDIDVAQMNEHDLMELLQQPRRRLFYNRNSGVGVHESENYPNGIALQVGLRYDIVNGIAIRNTLVTDGSQGQKDRRVAASSESIGITQKSGEADIQVYYLNLFNYSEVQSVNFPLGSRQ